MAKRENFDFWWLAKLSNVERAEVLHLWDRCGQLAQRALSRGPVVPAWFALRLLLVERARFSELMEKGVLEVFDVGRHRFVTGRSIDKFAKKLAKMQWLAVAPQWAMYYEELRRLTVAKGLLLPFELAAELLHISAGRLSTVSKQHHFEIEYFHGKPLVPLKSVSAYGEKRPRLGSEPYLPDESWTKEQEALLGTKTDRVVGEMLGRSCNRVRQRRRQLGIAPFMKQNRVRL